MQRYSQFTEDGITLALADKIQPPPFFLEIGCGNGLQNNTRILAEERGWKGVWVDADLKQTTIAAPIAEALGITLLHTFLSLPLDWVKALCPQHFGVLSIDVDGNDYHFWEALCADGALRPAVVIIEAQTQRPYDQEFVMPYEAGFVWDHKSQDTGASVRSMQLLGEQMGYTFIGKCPDYHSPNLFFVRNEFLGALT